MKCMVYRSDKKSETYLYLADGWTFDDLPANLRQLFGEPAFVMRLDLAGNRRLARVDTETVRENLEKEGYFLQLPPKLPIEEEISRRFS